MLAFPFVKDSLSSQWKTRGDFTMNIRRENAFLFKFIQEEDGARILELGSVQIAKKNYFLLDLGHPS